MLFLSPSLKGHKFYKPFPLQLVMKNKYNNQKTMQHCVTGSQRMERSHHLYVHSPL